jgi:thioredoxin reductase (NADPH)
MGPEFQDSLVRYLRDLVASHGTIGWLGGAGLLWSGSQGFVVLEQGTELRASQLLQDKVRNHPQFEVRTNIQVTELKAKVNKLASVLAKDRDSGEEFEFNPAAAFVFIGLDPNTGFLGTSVELAPGGFISTNDVFQTSIEGVFAAGDVRHGSTKQLGAAVGEGVAALLHVRQYLQKHAYLAAHDEEAA